MPGRRLFAFLVLVLVSLPIFVAATPLAAGTTIFTARRRTFAMSGLPSPMDFDVTFRPAHVAGTVVFLLECFTAARPKAITMSLMMVTPTAVRFGNLFVAAVIVRLGALQVHNEMLRVFLIADWRIRFVVFVRCEAERLHQFLIVESVRFAPGQSQFAGWKTAV